MSGSLKDQLLKAGFKPSQDASSGKPRNQQKNSRKSAGKSTIKPGAKKSDNLQKRKADELIEQRKQQKARIKILIETHAAKDTAGEAVYRFTLQNRIRELHLSETVRQGILAKEWVITRLNGSTYIIPAEIGEEILTINPAWAMVKINESSSDDTTDGYDDYQVPDDLIW